VAATARQSSTRDPQAVVGAERRARGGRRRRWLVGALLVTWGVLSGLARTGAAAQWGPALGGLPPVAAGRELGLGLGLGWAHYSPEDYLELLLGLSHRQPGLRLGLAAPLRLDLDTGGLRAADWDEPRDIVHVVRTFELHERGDPWHLQLGELASLTLGHGTLVDQGFPSLDPELPRTGLLADFQRGRGGAELLVDDLLEPGLVGGRLFYRPGRSPASAALAGPERLLVGATVAFDLDAPTALLHQTPPPGEPAAGSVAAFYVLDASGRPQVARSPLLPLLGLDATYALVTDPRAQLLAYGDLNGLLPHGAGLHLGLLLATRPLPRLLGAVRLEYRLASAGYVPGYAGTLYHLERTGLTGTPRAATLDAAARGQGFLGELAVTLDELCSLALRWEQQQGWPGGIFAARFELPGPGPLRGGLFYRRTGVDAPAALFGLDDALLLGELRAQLTPLVYLEGHLGQLWRLDPAPRHGHGYRAVWLGGAALGISLKF